ncbi:hypothetical protein JOB18_020739 [Solea senegalensis]|uniref:Uncharacterized protein n=1 Tax=Solea senegalensis TaxID=28829 RepID=A0AAV6RBE5_SOLSE|nr:hypothetical protein JOB18_020739 [Solea senegalensis]
MKVQIISSYLGRVVTAPSGVATCKKEQQGPTPSEDLLCSPRFYSFEMPGSPGRHGHCHGGRKDHSPGRKKKHGCKGGKGKPKHKKGRHSTGHQHQKCHKKGKRCRGVSFTKPRAWEKVDFESE